MLREQEAGAKTADVCRKYGISSATFYKWKAKYGGLEVSDAKRLKSLEDENAKPKKLLAEAELNKAMLKEIAAKRCKVLRRDDDDSCVNVSGLSRVDCAAWCASGYCLDRSNKRDPSVASGRRVGVIC